MNRKDFIKNLGLLGVVPLAVLGEKILDAVQKKKVSKVITITLNGKEYKFKPECFEGKK